MILEALSNAIGVSGDEGAVRVVIKQAIAEHVDELCVDNLGNLLAVKRGTGEVPLRVMLDAHMDEVGVMITSIESDGTLRFKPVGGIDPRIMLGKKVWVGSDKLPGVIGGKPVHLLRGKEATSVVQMDQMRIDIGAHDKDAAAAKVKPGDRATFATQFVDLGPTMLGKAFDDRAGCAVLVELLQADPYPVDVLAAFTVQEEVGFARCSRGGLSTRAGRRFCPGRNHLRRLAQRRRRRPFSGDRGRQGAGSHRHGPIDYCGPAAGEFFDPHGRPAPDPLPVSPHKQRRHRRRRHPHFTVWRSVGRRLASLSLHPRSGCLVQQGRF